MKYKYYLFNKPYGCVTAKTDTEHMTVMDYFPDYFRHGFHPVGRLDIDTVGLLIITNNGKFTNYLTEPLHHVQKKYFFYCFGNINEAARKNIETGPILSGGLHAKPSRLEITNHLKVADIAAVFKNDEREHYLKNPNGDITAGFITICEGKRHQVKRMIKTAGCHVCYLKRVQIGGLSLDNSLHEGYYRQMTSDDLKKLNFEE